MNHVKCCLASSHKKIKVQKKDNFPIPEPLLSIIY